MSQDIPERLEITVTHSPTHWQPDLPYVAQLGVAQWRGRTEAEALGFMILDLYRDGVIHHPIQLVIHTDSD